MSGDRRRLGEARQLPGTSLSLPTPHTTTTTTTIPTTTTTTVKVSPHTTEGVLPAIRAFPQFEHIQQQQPLHTPPQTTTTTTPRTSTQLPDKQLYPLNEPVQQKQTNLNTSKQSLPQTLIAHILNVSKTTPTTTTTTTPTTTTTTSSHSEFESSTPKFLSVPINHSSQKFEAKGEDVRLPNELAPNITRSQKREEDEYQVGDDKQKINLNVDSATSTVRGEKALFSSSETIKQLRNDFQVLLNTTLRSITAYTTAKTTTPRHTTARPVHTTTAERPVTAGERTSTFSTTTETTTSAAVKITMTPTTITKTTKTTTPPTTAGPQKIYLQEVEEITEVEEPDVNMTGSMQSKPLHTNSPTSRMLNLDTVEEKAEALPKTSFSNVETTEASNGKMVVEYLEEAELARSFPSTKWNMYEDQVNLFGVYRFVSDKYL